jgi:hypothetical protein
MAYGIIKIFYELGESTQGAKGVIENLSSYSQRDHHGRLSSMREESA